MTTLEFLLELRESIYYGSLSVGHVQLDPQELDRQIAKLKEES